MDGLVDGARRIDTATVREAAPAGRDGEREAPGDPMQDPVIAAAAQAARPAAAMAAETPSDDDPATDPLADESLYAHLPPLKADAGTASSDGQGLNSMRILAYTDDAELADSLGRLANGESVPWIDVAPGGLSAALMDSEAGADFLLVDIDDLPEEEAVAGLSQLVERPGAAVIAIGRRNDVRLFRAMLDAGAQDYLVQPLDERTLAEALTRKPAPAEPTVEAEEGHHTRLNLVIGARGGVGASTVAVDTAWWMAEQLGVQTALVDLDPQFGSCALALDLMPGRGLRDALESPDRIDSLFVGSAMMNAGDNLYVLAAEESPGEPVRAAPDGIGRLLDALAESFSCLVIDWPRHMVAADADVLSRVDTVTIVAEMTLAGLRDALRLKQMVESRSPAPTVALALRKAAGGKSAVDRKAFERGYGAAVDWELPALPAQAAEAAGRGVALVSRLRKGHPYAKAIAAMADRGVDPAGKPTKGKRKWLW